MRTHKEKTEMKESKWLEKSHIKNRSSWKTFSPPQNCFKSVNTCAEEKWKSPGNFRGCLGFNNQEINVRKMREPYRFISGLKFTQRGYCSSKIIIIIKWVPEIRRPRSVFICLWAESLMGCSHFRDWSPGWRNS